MQRRIVFSLLITVAFVFAMPIFEEVKCQSLNIYETPLPVWVTNQTVLDIAVDVFNMSISLGDVKDFGEGFYVNASYPQVLEVSLNGSIWFADESKFFNDSYAPTSLPSESDAQVIAQNFLDKYAAELRLDTFVFKNIGYKVTLTFNGSTGTIISNITNCRNVNFGYEIGGYPVKGPGAKITVSLGDGGEIIGFHRVWRELGNSIGSYEVMTPEEAELMLRQKLGLPDQGEALNITETQLVYYTEPDFVGQNYTQPVYVFDGYVLFVLGDINFDSYLNAKDAVLLGVAFASVIGGSGYNPAADLNLDGYINAKDAVILGFNWVTGVSQQIHFKTQVIPATPFSPVVNITSPIDRSRFSSTDTIPFDAEVYYGGNPPFTYTWESHVIGQIGNTKSFGASLPSLTRNGVTVAHSIKLMVIDALGNVAEDTILVYVREPPVASSTQMPAIWIAASLPVIVSLAATIILGFLITGKIGRKELVGLSLTAIIIANTLTISLACQAASQDDSNNKEVGIEWVNNYPWWKGGLENCDDDARGFAKKLGSDGWTWKFDWGNDMAWEEDFKHRHGSDGGTDFQQIDTVDFAYFAGHGSPEDIAFSNTNWDQQDFLFTTARWGGDDGGDSGEEADLEWIVLDACLTLKETQDGDDVFDRWIQAFTGLHTILGFHTTCTDGGKRGAKFAKYMIGTKFLGLTIIKPKKITDAWQKATKKTEDSDKWGAYIYQDNAGDDYLPGHGSVSSDPSDTIWTYCRWSC